MTADSHKHTPARPHVAALLVAGALSLVAASALAQDESWTPVVTTDGVTVTINGATAPVPNGPVQPTSPVLPNSIPANAPILYPNGFTENPVTNEWIVADTMHARLLRFASDTNPSYAAGTFLGELVTGVGFQSTAPYGPVVDDDGSVVVPNYYDNTISVFVRNGAGYTDNRVLKAFTNGGQADSFLYPVRVALVPDAQNRRSLVNGYGSLVVLDQANSRVIKFSLAGGLANASTWTVATAFGQEGVGPGQFYWPTGLAIDAAGRIYVSDPNNSTQITIQVFDPNGLPIQTITQGLSVPWGLAIDSTGRLFVTDTGNNRIAVYSAYNPADASQSLVPVRARIGAPSQPLGGVALPNGPNAAGPAGELQEPTAISFDHLGRLLVADSDNMRVQIFDRARLLIGALAVPQTIGAADAGVTVRVTLTRPTGDLGTLTAVHPVVPTATFSLGTGPATPVVNTTPDCITTPSSPSTCVAASALLPGYTMNPGDQLAYTFHFTKLGPAVGPVWFTANAAGVDESGRTVASPLAQTYAIATNGDQFNAPTISASISDPTNIGLTNGWYRSQPVHVDLSAAVSNPGADGDIASGDGQVLEIEYAIGPMAPAEGDFYSCYNLFTWLAYYGPGTPVPSCAVPIFKSGISTVWYRALSSRGLYDRLVPSAIDPSVKVPGWSSIQVNLDFTTPVIWFPVPTTAGGVQVPVHNGWYNKLPLNWTYRADDFESMMGTITSTPSAALAPPSPNGVTTIIGTAAFTAEGIVPFTVSATDLAGNTATFSDFLRIDATAPSFGAAHAPVSVTPVVTVGSTRWSRSSIGVSWDVTDAQSGFDQNATHASTCTSTVATGTNVMLSCTAQDWAGNSATSAQAGPFSIDTAAPTYTFTTSPAGVLVNGTIVYPTPPTSVTFTANDNGGSGFAGGQSLSVTVAISGGMASTTITDLVGNSVVAMAGPFTPGGGSGLTLTVPPNQTVAATSPSGAVVVYPAATAYDSNDGSLPVTCAPPSGSRFPIGTSTVTCSATNRSGVTATRSFTVTVTRSVPVCANATASPSSLWPPNHKFVAIGIGGVTNADGASTSLVALSIFQDEPTSGLGDGDTPIDGTGVGTSVPLVRAERSGLLDGRVYHIRFKASTKYGDSCTGDVTVGVPHDHGQGRVAVDQGPRYDSTVVSTSSTAHYDGDGCEHDRRRWGHFPGDGCAHDRTSHFHKAGDNCDHDRGRAGHYAGDGCEHERYR